MSSLRKTAMNSLMKRGYNLALQNNVEPLQWKAYYDRKESIGTGDGTFTLYRRGLEGIPIVCLHGGGYSGLTWALFANEITKIIGCQVFAIDLRGHGQTNTDDDSDLSLETLARDVSCVVNKLFESCEMGGILIGHSMGGAIAVEAAKDIENLLGICLIDVVEGTAMDSLSAMQGVLRHRPQYFTSIQNAIGWSYKSGQTHNMEAARISMPGQVMNFYTGRLAAIELEEGIGEKPATAQPPAEPFPFEIAENNDVIEEMNEDDEENDVQIADQVITKPPSLLSKKDDAILPTAKMEPVKPCSSREMDPRPVPKDNNGDWGKPPLPKFKKIETSAQPNAPLKTDDGAEPPSIYTWRIDLSKTEKYWPGWFQGLSQKFLNVRCPRILLLANINGLDTTLTVGQMQGKFQMQVLPRSGHAIHEDQPQRVAEIIGGFIVKHQLAVPLTAINCPMPGC